MLPETPTAVSTPSSLTFHYRYLEAYSCFYGHTSLTYFNRNHLQRWMVPLSLSGNLLSFYILGFPESTESDTLSQQQLIEVVE